MFLLKWIILATQARWLLELVLVQAVTVCLPVTGLVHHLTYLLHLVARVLHSASWQLLVSEQSAPSLQIPARTEVKILAFPFWNVQSVGFFNCCFLQNMDSFSFSESSGLDWLGLIWWSGHEMQFWTVWPYQTCSLTHGRKSAVSILTLVLTSLEPRSKWNK